VTLLIRPERGRLVAGVTRGIAEYYQLNTVLLRVVFIMAVLAAPISLLIYLLLWVSIPGETMVLGDIRLHAEGSETPAAHFDRFTHVLLHRTGITSEKRAIGPQVFAFVLLAAAFVFEMPRLEGANFYYAHPALSSLYSTILRHAPAAFYLTVSFAFLAVDRLLPAPVVLLARPSQELALEEGETKVLGGLMGGLGRATGVEPAILRVIFVLLNVLTFGAAGLFYLLLVWALRKEKRTVNSTPLEGGAIEKRGDVEPREGRLPTAMRVVVGFLFLVLALIRIATEFRIFFFNEPFFRGFVLLIVGLLFSLQAVRHGARSSIEKLWLLFGATVMLMGIYDLATAMFQVQLSFSDRFESIYVLGGLAFLYFSLVSLGRPRQKYGLAIAAMFFIAAGLVQFNVVPARFLLAMVQFYDFFFPVILAGFGLWLVMER
jgi:phage shock protein PspC (stress-responsive transcriptional regulator)